MLKIWGYPLSSQYITLHIREIAAKVGSWWILQLQNKSEKGRWACYFQWKLIAFHFVPVFLHPKFHHFVEKAPWGSRQSKKSTSPTPSPCSFPPCSFPQSSVPASHTRRGCVRWLVKSSRSCYVVRCSGWKMMAWVGFPQTWSSDLRLPVSPAQVWGLHN